MSDYNRMPPSDFNLPPGCYSHDEHFNPPDEDVQVERIERECGCVDHIADGVTLVDRDMCELHDAEFQAEKGFPYQSERKEKAA